MQSFRSTRAAWFTPGSALCLMLAACGGGGDGSFVASTPPPPPAPPPGPAVAGVTIFANPSPGEYATIGASIAGPGGNLDDGFPADASFRNVSTQASDQPQIRYLSGGYYEIKMPGADWDRLIPYKGLVDPSPENNYFQPQSVAQNLGYLATSNARLKGYSYSELASWGSAAAGRLGWLAFGTPSMAGAVPATGSATYSGIVQGTSDVLVADYLYGGSYAVAAKGSIALDFDFAKGTLGGAMTLSLVDSGHSVDLGTLALKDTVFSAGSTTYSGAFDTSASGNNFFLGRFTGPSAQETIGAWALPFMFTNGGGIVPPDNKAHQAFGAWIAKRP